MKDSSKFLIVVAALLAFGLSACASGPRPATSFISFEKAPRSVSEARLGNKTGKVCKQSILGFLTFGESGYYKAAKSGGIKKISSVSDSWTQIGPLYLKHCTIVTGS